MLYNKVNKVLRDKEIPPKSFYTLMIGRESEKNVFNTNLSEKTFYSYLKKFSSMENHFLSVSNKKEYVFYDKKLTVDHEGYTTLEKITRTKLLSIDSNINFRLDNQLEEELDNNLFQPSSNYHSVNKVTTFEVTNVKYKVIFNVVTNDLSKEKNKTLYYNITFKCKAQRPYLNKMLKDVQTVLELDRTTVKEEQEEELIFV